MLKDVNRNDLYGTLFCKQLFFFSENYDECRFKLDDADGQSDLAPKAEPSSRRKDGQKMTSNRSGNKSRSSRVEIHPDF